MKLKNFDKKNLVRIKNEFIQKSRYKLSVHAQRLIFAFIQNIPNFDDKNYTWKISLKELFKYLNIENNNNKYEIVRKSFLEIEENPLQWKISDKKWGIITWFSSAVYNENISNDFEICFHDEIIKFIYSLREYTAFEIGELNKLSSQYATILYPFFKQWEKKGRVEKTIQYLQEKTFTEKKYKFISQWIKNVIDIALKHINQKTNLCIAYVIKRKGRKYNNIEFFIYKKSFINKYSNFLYPFLMMWYNNNISKNKYVTIIKPIKYFKKIMFSKEIKKNDVWLENIFIPAHKSIINNSNLIIYSKWNKDKGEMSLYIKKNEKSKSIKTSNYIVLDNKGKATKKQYKYFVPHNFEALKTKLLQYKNSNDPNSEFKLRQFLGSLQANEKEMFYEWYENFTITDKRELDWVWIEYQIMYSRSKSTEK